jgi:branched-chain amino acid transport system substrate-binding protein
VKRLALLIFLALAAPAGAQSPQPLTIWSSLPLTGAGSSDARDVRDAERLALQEAGGTAGGTPIVLRSRNDATRQAGVWDPGKTAADARGAANDPSTIAYLGEFNSGATAIAIPILNQAGIATISPASTYAGLTRSPGGTEGEPDKYYPSGGRTFFRVAPADHLQAAAMAALLVQRGVKRLAIAHDQEDYGRIVSGLLSDAARARGIDVVLDARVARRGRNALTVAQRVRVAKPDAFAFIGVAASGAATVARAVHRRLPRIPIVTPDGCFDPAFTRPLGSATARRVLITSDVVPAAAGGPAAQAFAGRFRARWHRSPGAYAPYGYEAMALALDAINRAGAAGDRRAAVVAALAATTDRDSVLGRYSIDGFGDTTLSSYGVYVVRRGLPAFSAVVDSAG